MEYKTLPLVSEIRQSCLVLHLQRATRVIARQFDDAFRPIGISSGQFSLLVALDRPEPPTISALAGDLAMDRTTLTKNLKPLERRGLISSTVVPEDTRARALALTENGRDLLARAIPLWQDVQADAVSDVPNPDSLRATLRAMAFSN